MVFFRGGQRETFRWKNFHLKPNGEKKKFLKVSNFANLYYFLPQTSLRYIFFDTASVTYYLFSKFCLEMFLSYFAQ